MDPSGAGWCVTANLEKGHAHGTLPWLERALAERPAMVFAQELNRRSTVESLATTYGYHPVVWPAHVEPRWWMVSWIMVRDDLALEPLEGDARKLLAPFSSYVAAARVGWPPLGSMIVLVLVTAAVTFYLLLIARRREALLVLVAVGGGQILSSLLKLGIDRPRPDRPVRAAGR
jgi:hypothetical protein